MFAAVAAGSGTRRLSAAPRPASISCAVASVLSLAQPDHHQPHAARRLDLDRDLALRRVRQRRPPGQDPQLPLQPAQRRDVERRRGRERAAGGGAGDPRQRRGDRQVLAAGDRRQDEERRRPARRLLSASRSAAALQRHIAEHVAQREDIPAALFVTAAAATGCISVRPKRTASAGA